MQSQVSAPQILGLDGYCWMLEGLQQCLSRGAQEVRIDLAKLERAYPDGVLPLIATLMRLRWVPPRINFEVILPNDPYLRQVFDGVGWTHHLTADRAEFVELPRRTPQFTPATAFASADELEAVRRSIMQVVLSQGKLAEWLPEAIEWSLWEVMENVLNHSEGGVGWVQLSTFRETNHANLVVVDCGVGIRGSLSQRFSDLDDQKALKIAVEEGGTRDPRRNAGYGLTGTARIALSNRGELVVLSGGCKLTVEAGTAKQGNFYRYSRKSANHQGTLVELELRTHRPVNPKTAFPTPPPRLIESLPGTGREYVLSVAKESDNVGTREAGRHLRNRISNLRQGDLSGHFVLDFEGLNMLSSSFADELVAKLAEELGKAEFFRHFELKNMGQAVSIIVETTLWTRLG